MKLDIQLFASINVGDTYETTPIGIRPYGSQYSSNAYQMKFSVKLNSQNLANFTSNITITSYMRTLANSWGWSGFKNNIYMERYVKVNNETNYTRKNETDIQKLPTNNANNWVNCGSWSGDVNHASNGTCTLYVKSYINTTNASSYSYIPRATEQESEALILPALHKNPVINITGITEMNNYLTGVANNVIVQNLSTKRFDLSTTLYDSATISNITLSNGNTTATGTSSQITLDFINKNVSATNNTATIKAVIKDSYNSTGETQKTYTVIPYNKPSINTTTTVKRNGQLSGKVLLNLTGTFYNHTIGDRANTITVDYKHWEKGTTEPNSWTIIPNASVSVSGDNVSVSNYEIGTTDTSASNYFNFQKSYNVKIRIYDNMRISYASSYTYMSNTITKTIPLGEDVWGEYKDRLRIKKIENPNGIYSYNEGQVNTASGKNALLIKKATLADDGTPSDGVVMEYGNTTYTGQIFLTKGANNGVYYNGWSNGVRGTWRKFAYSPVVLYNDDTGIQSKSYASVSNLSSYSKLAITFSLYRNNDEANTGGTANMCWLDLTKVDSNGYARSGIVVAYSSAHLSNGNAQSNDFKALFEADINNNRVYCLFVFNGAVKIESNYVMTKIEGYY